MYREKKRSGQEFQSGIRGGFSDGRLKRSFSVVVVRHGESKICDGWASRALSRLGDTGWSQMKT